MLVLSAFLIGGIGASTPAAEPPLPVSLGFHVGVALPETPELDELWPVLWLDVCLVDPAEDLFHWPEFTIRRETRPPAAGESWEPYFTSRIELGVLRLQQMEAEPRFFPAVTQAVFGLPMGLIEALTSAVSPNAVILNGKEVFNQVNSTQDLATIMAFAIVKAETKTLSGLRTSELNTFGAQMGTEEPENDRFRRLQWRMLFTATKNAYRERYQIPTLDMDTILSAVSTGNWTDFVVVPSVVSVYAAKFGIDRKIRISDDVRVDFRIEKYGRFKKVLTTDHGGRLISGSINLFNLPVSALVSIESMGHGRMGFEFIGIGTDIGAALSGITNGKPREMRDFR
jgi:hypothetical protein